MNAIDKKGRYHPKEIVGVFHDKMGDERIVHRPKGRALRVLKNNDTPTLRMNRVANVLIGQNIREKRIEVGMSLEELGVRAGLKSAKPKNYVWAIENATRDNGVRIGTVFAIAAALGCEAADLLPSTQQVMAASEVSFGTTVSLA